MARFLILGVLALAASAANAHFLLLYTPNVNLPKAAEAQFKLLFWHPLENGPVMQLERPEAIYYRHRGKQTDLRSALRPIDFRGTTGSASAFEFELKLNRLGDYTFVVAQAPYFEQSEDKYIQQFVKVFVSRGAIPVDWSESLGLPAEIKALNRPTNVLAGSTFTGRVLAAGQPVAGAEIEVEYVAAPPDMQRNEPGQVTARPSPGGAIVARSDADGFFTFGIPRAGYWGFAALDVGPLKTHKGKPLSQDAVLWIRALDFE